jgi:hypothetical protein
LISVVLARRLREAGLPWTPAAGDRFVVADRDMDTDVFVVSELTIEVRGRSFHFNGTTEWALDSVEQDDVVWLPYEGQLREALGARFRSLEPVGDGWAVTTTDGRRHVDVDAERAYARAVLSNL